MLSTIDSGCDHYFHGSDRLIILAYFLEKVLLISHINHCATIVYDGQERLPHVAQLLAEHRQALGGMGHPQPPTRVRIGSKPAHGALTGIMKQKRTKSADMNANWVKDRCEQGQLELRWAPGPTNLGGSPTKHQTGLYHRQARPIYLFAEGKSPTTLQGWNRILDPGSKAQSSVTPGSSLVESLRRLVARAGRL